MRRAETQSFCFVLFLPFYFLDTLGLQCKAYLDLRHFSKYLKKYIFCCALCPKAWKAFSLLIYINLSHIRDSAEKMT